LLSIIGLRLMGYAPLWMKTIRDYQAIETSEQRLYFWDRLLHSSKIVAWA